MEESHGALLVERQQLPRGLPYLSERVLDAPELALVLEAVLADEVELQVESVRLGRSTRRVHRLRIDAAHPVVRHSLAVPIAWCALALVLWVLGMGWY